MCNNILINKVSERWRCTLLTQSILAQLDLVLHFHSTFFCCCCCSYWSIIWFDSFADIILYISIIIIIINIFYFLFAHLILIDKQTGWNGEIFLTYKRDLFVKYKNYPIDGNRFVWSLFAVCVCVCIDGQQTRLSFAFFDAFPLFLCMCVSICRWLQVGKHFLIANLTNIVPSGVETNFLDSNTCV